MTLRHMQNNELFLIYDKELKLRLQNIRNLQNERRLLARFREHLNGFPPSALLAKGFLAQFTNKKPRTLIRYASTIKSFMSWYGEPINDLKVKIPKTLPPYTKDNEVESLFGAIENKKTHKKNITRDALMVELALKTGMRRGEVANLEVKDIHSDFLLIRKGKGNKDRVIPLIPAISQRLQNFIKGKAPDEKVFSLKATSISNKIRLFAKKAGLDSFHTHTMRHKFATDLLERGANIKVVQELLGHSNLGTTEIYLSVTDQALKDAVRLLDKPVKRKPNDKVNLFIKGKLITLKKPTTGEETSKKSA